MNQNIQNAVALASEKTAGFDDLRQAVLILGMELDRLAKTTNWLAKLKQDEQDKLDWEMSNYYAEVSD